MATDPRLVKLVAILAELREKEDAVVAEIAALANGDEGIGPKVVRLKALWQATWFERYHSDYTFTNYARVGADFKKLLKAHSEAEIGARMFTYIKSDEVFYVKARHSVEIFVRGFNAFVGIPAVNGDIHSADKAREMRGA